MFPTDLRSDLKEELDWMKGRWFTLFEPVMPKSGICLNLLKSGMNIIFLSPKRLPGRNDVTWDKVNFRSDIMQNIFSENQKFAWLLKQYGVTVP